MMLAIDRSTFAVDLGKKQIEALSPIRRSGKGNAAEIERSYLFDHTECSFPFYRLANLAFKRSMVGSETLTNVSRYRLVVEIAR